MAKIRWEIEMDVPGTDSSHDASVALIRVMDGAVHHGNHEIYDFFDYLHSCNVITRMKVVQ